MTPERLNEIMAEQYSYITYDTELAKEYLECGAPQADEGTIAWCFVNYLFKISSVMVDNKRLDELMLEKYPQIVYTAEQSDEFLKKYEGDLADEDVVARDFAKYVSKAEKFIVIKTIGKHGYYVVREFDDEESAKLFVSLLCESEQYDFVRYHIAKVIKY